MGYHRRAGLERWLKKRGGTGVGKGGRAGRASAGAGQAPAGGLARAEITLTPRQGLAAVLGVGLVLVACYGRLVPRGQGPDEESHWLCILTWAGQEPSPAGWAWGLPVFSTTDTGINFETHQPPLYYAVSAGLYRLGGETVVRGFGLLCYLLLALVTWALVSGLAGPAVALAATAFVAWLPMQAFLAWRLNNDGLTNLLWAVALWRWCVALQSGPGVTEGWRSGLAVGAALLCKQSSLGLLVLAVLAGLLAGWSSRRWRPALAQIGVCLAVALALAGWWYLRNQLLYGDFMAQTAFDARFLHTRATRESLLQSPLANNPRWSYWPYVFDWIVRTSVIYLGHNFFRLPADVYPWHLSVLALAGGLGLVGFVGFARRRPRAPAVAAGLLLGAGMLLAALMLVKFNTVYFQAQGRYLFVMLPGWGLWLAGGASRAWRAGSPLRRYLLWAMPAWLGLLNLLLLAVYVPGLFESG